MVDIKKQIDEAMLLICPLGVKFRRSWVEDEPEYRWFLYTALFEIYGKQWGFRFGIDYRYIPMSHGDLLLYAFRVAQDEFLTICRDFGPMTRDKEEKAIELALRMTSRGGFYDAQVKVRRDFSDIVAQRALEAKYHIKKAILNAVENR